MRLRLIGLTLAVTLITVGGATLLGNANRREERRRAVREAILGEARLLASVLPEPTAENLELIRRLIAQAYGRSGTPLSVIAADGTVLAESDLPPDEVIRLPNEAQSPEVRDALARGVGIRSGMNAAAGRPHVHVAVRWGPLTAPWGVVRSAASLSRLEREAQRGEGRYLWILLGSLAVAGFLGGMAAHRLVQPIAALQRSAQVIGSGHLDHRADIRGTAEMKWLAHAINHLAGSVQGRIAEVETERTRLAQLLSRMPDGVLALDEEGRITLVNDAARRLLDLDATVVGRAPVEAIRHPELQRAADEALAGGEPATLEVTLTGPERRILGVALVPIPSGLVVVLNDRTRLRRLESARRDMVANVGHDLRTPLAAILGYLETLVESPDLTSDQRSRFLEVIARNARRLERLVNDLTHLSTLESPQPRFNPVRLSIPDLVLGAVETVAPRAAKRAVKLLPRLDPGLPAVQGDRHHLETVFLNLLDNSLRVSRDGGTITLRGERVADGVRLSVEDQGPGIPRELRERVFERFYRLDMGRTTEEGGSGLGLAIVKHAVLIHGGDVWIEDVPGGGTRIVFTLPAAPPEVS